jgi:TRAP-type C4-dicarboxylate transport system permease small subunit
VAQRARPNTAAVVAAIVGALLLIVSAFLVWGSLDIKIGTISEKGTDSAAGLAVIVLGIGVLALLVGSFAGLPRGFVRGAWALFGVAAIGLGVYALIQINNAPADFFSDVSSALKDSGLSGPRAT